MLDVYSIFVLSLTLALKKPEPSHVVPSQLRVRNISAAMHLMVRIVVGVGMFCPVAPTSGLETDAIAILVTCKLDSIMKFIR